MELAEPIRGRHSAVSDGTKVRRVFLSGFAWSCAAIPGRLRTRQCAVSVELAYGYMNDIPNNQAETDDETPSSVTPLALRPREAAAALGIGTRKLWEITADKTSGIPHLRIGRTVLYPVDELRTWLAERAAKGVKR